MPLSIMYQQSRITNEVTDDKRLANIMPIYRKDRREHSGNHRPVSLASVPERVMKHMSSLGMYGATRASDTASLDLGKAGPD